MENILSSLISGITAIVVCVITQIVQNGKTRALIDFRMQIIENKQDKFNNVIERTYKLEEVTALHEEKIKVANHRIEDLERSKK